MDAELRKSWSINCPIIFKPNFEPWDLTYDEETMQDYLLLPLIKLLTNDQDQLSALTWKEKVQELFRRFCQKNNLDTDLKGSGQICGKLFRSGDPTYSCKECATDSTCVMCHDCFFNSEHIKHKYKVYLYTSSFCFIAAIFSSIFSMHTSCGSGYCDCGDSEAWKTGHLCTNHQANNSPIQQHKPLPPTDLCRMRNVMRVLLEYCMQLLCWEYEEGGESSLPNAIHLLPHMPYPYQCILINDEHHTYDQRAILCTTEQAQLLATVVDREGHSSVLMGSEDECAKTKHIIQERTRRDGGEPLGVQVVHSSIVALQIFAVKLVNFIHQLIPYFPPLLHVIGDVLLNEHTSSDESQTTLLEAILCNDRKFWKSARSVCHQLLMSTLLMDMQMRFKFAEIFTKLYGSLIKDYLSDDHDHSISVISLSVQVYTVPTIARHVICKCNALAVILETVIDMLSDYESDNDNDTYSFQGSRMPMKVRRLLCIFNDLKYLLNTPPKDCDWTDDLRDAMSRAAGPLSQFLSKIQGMDSVRRMTETHQEYESEWETAFNIQLRVQHVLPLYRNAMVNQKEVVDAVFDWFVGCDKLEYICNESEEFTDMLKVKVLSVDGVEFFNVAKHAVSKNMISIHTPLTRFIAAIYPYLNEENLKVMGSGSLVCVIFSYSIRILILLAQSQAGMWRRNGYTIINQLHNYTNSLCRTEMLDKDIMALQMCAHIMHPDEFVLRVVRHFGLTHPHIQPNDDTSFDEQIELSTVECVMYEEMLQLFITIYGERFIPQVGKGITERDCWKRDVIHMLVKGPLPFSDIEKNMPNDPKLEENATLEEIVREVANLRKPTSAGRAAFELKDECWIHVNQFYYHYTKEDLSHVEKSTDTKWVNGRPVCAPFCPPKWMDMYRGVEGVGYCTSMIILLQDCIKRYLEGASNTSDLQLQRAMYLIGLVVEDELNNYAEPKFTKMVQENLSTGASLKDCLQKLVTSPLTHSLPENAQILIKWVMKRYDIAVGKYSEVGDDNAVHSKMDVGNVENVEEERKKKKEQADVKRQRAMRMMATLQKSFLQKNADLLEESTPEEEEEIMDEGVACELSYPVCVGPSRTRLSRHKPDQRLTCVLCQESEQLSFDGNAMVLVAYVQQSTLFSKAPLASRVVSDAWRGDPLIMPADLFLGTHTSTCGHTMHAQCCKVFCDSLRERERTRPFGILMPTRHIDVAMGEYPCPLCKRHSNCALPMIPMLSPIQTESWITEDECETFAMWLERVGRNVIELEERNKQVQGSVVQGNQWTSPSPPSTTPTLQDLDSEMADGGPLGEGLLQILSQARFPNVGRFLTRKPHQEKQKKKTYFQLCVKMSESILTAMEAFALSVHKTGLCCVPSETFDIGVLVMSWQSTIYTIRCLAAVLKKENKPLFGAFNTRQSECLTSLVRFGCVVQFLGDPKEIENAGNTCLKVLTSQAVGPLNDVDVLNTTLTLIMAGAWFTSVHRDEATKDKVWYVPYGSTYELNIIKLGLNAHIFQLMSTYNPRDLLEDRNERDTYMLNSVDNLFLQVYNKMQSAESTVMSSHMSHKIHSHLKFGLRHFLRPLALFFNTISQVSPPEALRDPGIDEFEPLCRYLGLPDRLEQLIEQVKVDSMWERWLFLEGEWVGRRVTTQPLTVNCLQPLPHHFSELVHCAAEFRVRDCRVMLQSSRIRGCFKAAPYVDEFGETDDGFRRGNPLTLQPELYANIERIWLHHNVAEEISNRQEIDARYINQEWNHF